MHWGHGEGADLNGAECNSVNVIFKLTFEDVLSLLTVAE